METQERKLRTNLDTDLLKLVAIAAMLVDHIGGAFFPEIPVFRWIGRLAFPLFCYCMTVGLLYTHDIRRYLGRLAIFAVVSQPFWILAFNADDILGNLTNWNIFFTLFLSLLAMWGPVSYTHLTLVSFALHRRIGLSERLIMVSTLNLNDMDGVVRVVRHALIGTFAMETAGAVLMSVCLIPEFGFLKGTWHAVFHAVSSFCNAGFDLLGGRFGAFSSLAGYNDNPLMLGTTAALIVVGGLGFFVWEDIVDKRCWSRLSVYSKMVLLITAVLIVGGALFLSLIHI